MSILPIRNPLALMVAMAAYAIFPAPVVAQTVVTIDAFGFQPNSRTIKIGDSILWFNLDANSVHTTTSDKPPGNPDYWNVSLNYQSFYTRTFPRAGTFTYHDNVSGFTGTIIVTAPTLTAPRMVNGQFLFDATELTVGRTNLLQASTNLAAWSNVQTNTASASSMTFSNSASGNYKFYRLIELR